MCVHVNVVYSHSDVDSRLCMCAVLFDGATQVYLCVRDSERMSVSRLKLFL